VGGFTTCTSKTKGGGLGGGSEGKLSHLDRESIQGGVLILKKLIPRGNPNRHRGGGVDRKSLTKENERRLEGSFGERTPVMS